MVKTAPLDEDTHTYLKRLQMTLAEKHKRNITIADIVAGMSKILIDIDDTARKIIHVRARDHEQIIYGNDDTSDKNNGENGGKGPGIELVKEDDVKT